MASSEVIPEHWRRRESLTWVAVADRAVETSVCCALAGHRLMPLGRRLD
jgi:hypothetical protein